VQLSAAGNRVQARLYIEVNTMQSEEQAVSASGKVSNSRPGPLQLS
jgi:hypothetical protein